MYYGFDADGKETNCVKFNEMTSCAEIFKPVSMYKKVCEDAGETSFNAHATTIYVVLKLNLMLKTMNKKEPVKLTGSIFKLPKID